MPHEDDESDRADSLEQFQRFQRELVEVPHTKEEDDGEALSR